MLRPSQVERLKAGSACCQDAQARIEFFRRIAAELPQYADRTQEYIDAIEHLQILCGLGLEYAGEVGGG